MDVAPRQWTRAERDLWQRISDHSFENPDLALDFTHRLARTLGWPLASAGAAVLEYRRFCFLAMVTTGAPVTPSEEVDEVWHLHLTYSRDYWDRWCGTALGRALHHDPTQGGPDEARKYRAQYADTLALYESYFGPPPADFWPGTAQRFSATPRFRMIDAHRGRTAAIVAWRGRMKVPTLATLAWLASASGAAAQATPGITSFDPLDWTAQPFLTLYIVLLAGLVAVCMIARSNAKSTGRPANTAGLDPAAIAYLRRGIGAAFDTLMLELATQGAVRFDKRGIEVGPGAASLSPRWRPLRALEPGQYTRAQLFKRFTGSEAGTALGEDLQRRNLVPTTEDTATARWIAIVGFLALIAFGLLKIAVGMSRDKPVGFLVMLAVVATVMLVRFAQSPRLTSEGDRVLADMRAANDRLVRAPREVDLPLAFAIVGATVLAGSDHAAYARQVAAAGSSGGGCGGGGGGCGGGGGGCGGCGS